MLYKEIDEQTKNDKLKEDKKPKAKGGNNAKK
jgi:hypothetical protein